MRMPNVRNFALFGVFVLLMILIAGCSGQKQPESVAMSREQGVWDSVKAKQWDKFKEVLHPDYVGVYADGCRSAAQEVTATQGVNIQSIQIEEARIAQEGQTTEVVSYRAIVKGSASGQEFSGAYNMLSIWVRVNSGWKMIAHSEAAVP